MYKINSYIFILTVICLLFSCKKDKEKTAEEEKKTIAVPPFDQDSAYNFIKKQVDFGPRVPNSAAHKACATWLVNKLTDLGATVIQQSFQVKNFKGETMNGINIIGSINPQHKNRIMLAAHWDTRFMADKDADVNKQKQPILGADDGGSGVAVLLEVARAIQMNPIDLGVDIVFFDAEDQGDNSEDPKRADAILQTWCMGAQYWSKNPHQRAYRPNFAILLDMVGAKDARFTKERVSQMYAEQTMNKVWQVAQELGYGNYFVNANTSGITDDHYFVNTIAQIPMIDIINSPDGLRFGKHWHTHQDDMNVIDKNTLNAVGTVVLSVLYKSSVGGF